MHHLAGMLSDNNKHTHNIAWPTVVCWFCFMLTFCVHLGTVPFSEVCEDFLLFLTRIPDVSAQPQTAPSVKNDHSTVLSPSKHLIIDNLFLSRFLRKKSKIIWYNIEYVWLLGCWSDDYKTSEDVTLSILWMAVFTIFWHFIEHMIKTLRDLH